MLITVMRTNKTADGVFGSLTLDSGSFKCVTLENLKMIIPSGTYDILFMWSDKFSQIMPHIIVPKREAIEIHWANYPVQLQGCLALGTQAEIEKNAVWQSKIAWTQFVQEALTDVFSIKIRFVEDYK